MTTDDKIKDEGLQYDINTGTAKISELSWGKSDKYEYLTGEEILPSDQNRTTEQAQLTYSLLGKAFEKYIKTIEEVPVLEVLKPNIQKLTIKDAIPQNTLTEEAKSEINRIKEIEKMVGREN